MLIKVICKLSGEFRRPVFGPKLRNLLQQMPLDLKIVRAGLLKDTLVITSQFEEIPDISTLIGLQVFDKRVINVKGVIANPEEVEELPREGCSQVRIATPYPFNHNGIPAIREVVKSSLAIWKEATGQQVKVGKLTPLQVNLTVIRGRWGRGVVGRITLKGEGAPAFGQVASFVGSGEMGDQGYGYIELMSLDCPS